MFIAAGKMTTALDDPAGKASPGAWHGFFTSGAATETTWSDNVTPDGSQDGLTLSCTSTFMSDNVVSCVSMLSRFGECGV